MKNLILASGSPRRKELLYLLDIPFTICVADIEEVIDKQLPLGKAIEQVAHQKAKAVQTLHPQDVILAADTIVCVDGKILGKPHTEANAFQMLSALSGKMHQVITGVSILYEDNVINFYETSDVTFYDLSETDIKNYIATGETLDKAGAYAIQGKGAILVAKISGDYYNIVGLPIAKVYRQLKALL